MQADSFFSSYELQAELRSKTFGTTGDDCMMTFYYHLYDTIGNSLVVLVRGSGRGGALDQHKWQFHNNTDNTAWHYAEVKIGHHHDFEIAFQTRVESGLDGTVAVDDIKFMNCSEPGKSICGIKAKK